VKYIFDINICIFIARKTHPLLQKMLESLAEEDAVMSVVTYCELVFGSHKSHRAISNMRILNCLVEVIPVLSLFHDMAAHYGQTRKALPSAPSIC